MAVYSIIMGLVFIFGGISLFSTPITTFLSAGYFVIILFFLSGISGLVKAVAEKVYDKAFFFSLLSLILGILGLVIPGAGLMNNFIILYLASGWLFVRAILSFMDAYKAWKNKEGLGSVLPGILMGVLDIVLSVYSVLHPDMLALALGFLVGLYFIETGVNMIVLATDISNISTVILTIAGVVIIFLGFALSSTPLGTFLGSGYYLIILFFIFGVIGIVRGVVQKCYDKNFFFAILSLILGILGLVIPGAGSMNNYLILYLAAGWLFVRGILSILEAIEVKKKGGDTGMMVLGILMGILDFVLGVFSVAYPALLMVALGILIGFFFIETGIHMIIFGSLLAGEGEAKEELTIQ